MRNFFKIIFTDYHVFCLHIMAGHLAECNKKANLGKNIKNHFRKPFLDLECSNFTESVSRLIRNYCKITFFCSENRPTLKRICVFFKRNVLFVFFYTNLYFFAHACILNVIRRMCIRMCILKYLIN